MMKKREKRKKKQECHAMVKQVLYHSPLYSWGDIENFFLLTLSVKNIQVSFSLLDISIKKQSLFFSVFQKDGFFHNVF